MHWVCGAFHLRQGQNDGWWNNRERERESQPIDHLAAPWSTVWLLNLSLAAFIVADTVCHNWHKLWVVTIGTVRGGLTILTIGTVRGGRPDKDGSQLCQGGNQSSKPGWLGSDNGSDRVKPWDLIKVKIDLQSWIILKESCKPHETTVNDSWKATQPCLEGW